MLPYLACYLGHADLRGTQYYLHLFHDNLDIVTNAMTVARKKALGKTEDSSDDDEG